MVPPTQYFSLPYGVTGLAEFRGVTEALDPEVDDGPVLQTLIRGGVLTAWAGFIGRKGNALPEEEANMTCAALPAAVGTQQNQREENRLKEAASPRAKDLPAPTEGTATVTYRKRDGLRHGPTAPILHRARTNSACRMGPSHLAAELR